MHTTEQIIQAVTNMGCLGDLIHNIDIGNVGGAKFIIRACMNISLTDADWINFGVILNLHDALCA